MPPGYPGYSYLCPMGFTSLLTPWVAVIGSLAYALWIETALLAVGTLWLPRRQALSRGSLFSIGIVAIAALVASIADGQTAQLDAITCHFGFYTHYDFKRVQCNNQRAKYGYRSGECRILDRRGGVPHRHVSHRASVRPRLAREAARQRGVGLLTRHDETTQRRPAKRIAGRPCALLPRWR